MPHTYRNSRGGILEWRTREASTAITLAPRSQQLVVSRGRRAFIRSAPSGATTEITLTSAPSVQNAISANSEVFLSLELLSGTNVQLNNSSNAEILIGFQLLSTPSQQSNISSNSSIYKNIALTSEECNTYSQSSSVSIQYILTLQGTANTSSNVSSVLGNITQAYGLLAAPCTQHNYSGKLSLGIPASSNTYVYTATSSIEYKDYSSGFTLVTVKTLTGKDTLPTNVEVIRNIGSYNVFS